MPRMELNEENKQESVFDYPKLRLTKDSKYARILLLEDAPLFAYTHNLRAPQIVEGRVVYETVNKFGKETQEVKTDFIGNPLCNGDVNVLQKKGIDPENCPACEIASTSDAVEPPKRRFAYHAVVYNTKPGGTEISDQYGVRLVAWLFTDKVFNQLVGFKKEWGDLRKHDLLLGPLVNEQFQNYDIAVAGRAEWLQNGEEAKQATVATFKGNQCSNLEALIGRKVTDEQMQEDLNRVMSRYRMAFGADVPDSVEASDDLDVVLDVDSLLEGETTSDGIPPEADTIELPVEAADVVDVVAATEGDADDDLSTIELDADISADDSEDDIENLDDILNQAD